MNEDLKNDMMDFEYDIIEFIGKLYDTESILKHKYLNDLISRINSLYSKVIVT